MDPDTDGAGGRPGFVHDLLASAARDMPGALAIVEDGGRAVTWAELDGEVTRVAAAMSAAGVVGGHRVMIVLSNRLEFVTTYLGALRAGAVAVPVNPRSSPDELGRMLADSGARLVVAEAETAAPTREAIAGLPAAEVEPRLYVVAAEPLAGEHGYAELAAGSDIALAAVNDAEGLAVLLYTSGTSGRPRAAMLSHRALLANIDQIAAKQPPMIRPDDVVLGVLPLFHVYGLNAVLGSCLRHCTKLVLTRTFEPEETLDLIDDAACSLIPVAPPVFGYWLHTEDIASRLSCVRLMLSGSAPLAPAVMSEFEAVAKVPVHQGYGLTEAAPVVSTTLGQDNRRMDSVGQALPGVEIALFDDSGAATAGEDPGEIWIRGDNLFDGYWPDGADGPDESGWWPTGDVGFLDEEGNLQLVDRVKELVIVSGFNVYPSEVEELIVSLGEVRAAAVIGVDDPQTGEAVVAYVQPSGGTADAELQRLVTQLCEQRLARFKWPSRVEIVDSLPQTVTGKVQKGRLRGMERRRQLELIE